MGPGVAMECLAKNGPHVFEDHFLAEVVDPDTGEPLPPGERGELVFTSLTKEAFPVIRYRTRDITALDTAPCGCGRTLARMVRVTGRTDDMLIIRGVNVFPSQIESLLVGMPGRRAALPADRRPRRPDGHPRGPGRDDRGALQRRGQEARDARAAHRERHQGLLRRHRQGQAGGAQVDPAQRGQGPARDRQAEADGGDADGEGTR